MPAKKLYTFEQFAAVRRFGAAPTLSFSPDGSEIVYTINTSGQYNIWRQSTSGGYPHQLTTYIANTVRTVAWSPDGKWVGYNADHDGDEFHQVYMIPARGGRPEQLTHTAKAQHHISSGSWSPDGRYFAYFANDRTPTAMDVQVWDKKTGEHKRVFAGDAYYAFGGWSPDSKRLLAIEANSNTDTNIYLVNRSDGSGHLLTPHEGDVLYAPGPWAADGSGFFLISDQGREFTGLAFFDVNNGKMHWVEKPRWDVEDVAGSHDGRYLAWVVNENGYSRLYVRNQRTNKRLTLPKLPRGTISALTFSPDGNLLAMLISTPASCDDLFVIDFRKRTLKQLTYSMLGGIDPRQMIKPTSIRYPSFDGRMIAAFQYKPKQAHVDNKMPVILSIHGGPEAQERPRYQYAGLYQYWLSRGIGVLAPNIRGSTGYGKSYQMLIHGDWGGDELKDIEAAAKYLQALDWVDAKRIGVFGGSFGGFATLSAASRLPAYWAAAVDIVGPSNLVSFVKSVPPHWLRFMEKWVGHPERDYEELMYRSPINYVDQIKAPLFIIQGAKDPRVVKAESDQIVDKLRAQGVEVKYDVYEDEGHGFTKRANELKAWKDTALFMEGHLQVGS